MRGGWGGEEEEDWEEEGERLEGADEILEASSGDEDLQEQQHQQQQHQESDSEGRRGLLQRLSLAPPAPAAARHSRSPSPRTVPRSATHVGIKSSWRAGESECRYAVESIPEDAVEISLSFSGKEASGRPQQAVDALEAGISELRELNRRMQGVEV